MKKNLSLLLLVLSILASCGKSSSGGSSDSTVEALVKTESLINNAIEFEQASNTQIARDIKIKKSSDGIEWKKEYTDTLTVALSDSSFKELYEIKINQADLNLVGCKNFNDLSLSQKQTFYIVYLAAIAEAESDFKTHMETFNKSDRTMNIGLLQIDQAVANNHTKGRLGSLDDGDLKEGNLNLKVGVFVLRNQVRSKVAYSRLFPAKSYYWEVLTIKKRVLKNIEANRSNIEFCER